MKTIYLHIGTGKTGTSAIQNFLFDNRKVLREVHDLDYPDHGLSSNDHFGEIINAHYRLTNWIQARNDAEIRHLAALVEKSPYKRAVISAETLYHGLTEEDIEWLRKALSAFRVEIICYVRRQDEYIESAWKQQAKTGAMRAPFGDFIQRHRNAEFLGEVHANYFRMLAPWAKHFGKNSIRLRVFSKDEFFGGSLFSDFLHACDCDTTLTPDLLKQSVVNASVPAEVAELNRRAAVAGLVPANELPAFTAFLQGLSDFQKGSLMSVMDRASVVKNYVESNRKLFLEYRNGTYPKSFVLDGASCVRPLPPRTLEEAALRCLVAAWREAPRNATATTAPHAAHPPKRITRAMKRALHRMSSLIRRLNTPSTTPGNIAPLANDPSLPVWPPLTSDRELKFEPEIKAERVVEIIRDHQSRKQPLSIIRLGDGEAAVMGYPEYVNRNLFEKFLKVFFGENKLDSSQSNTFVTELRESIRYADIIGVHGGAELNKFTGVRLLLDLYSLPSAETLITGANLHRQLQEKGLFRAFLQGQERVGVITCRHVAETLMHTFDIKAVDEYLIPEEAQHIKQHGGDPRKLPRHFPDAFDRLRKEIVVHTPGMIFLVGAGPCGKVYCRWIKERGGIAVDIGSVFDGWAGLATRAYMRNVGEDGKFQIKSGYKLET